MIKKKIRLKNILVLLLIFVFALVFICFVPDLLLTLRSQLKGVPVFKNLVYPNVKDVKYMEIILTLLLNCIAIIISVFALYTSQSYTKTQVSQQKAKIIEASSNLEEIVGKNMKVIFELKDNVGNIMELLIDRKILRKALSDAAILYSVDIISRKDYIFLKKFVNRVSEIKSSHDLGRDQDKEEQIKKFCEQYFEENTLQYTEEVQCFLKSLHKLYN